MILYGKPVAESLLNTTAENVKKCGKPIMLSIIANPCDEASKVYIKNKYLACTQCGINCQIITMEPNSTTQDYLKVINKLNNDLQVNGIIVQLPLLNGIKEKAIQDAILPEKDVDGFSLLSKFPPCTPSGIISIIDFYKGKDFLCGKNAVVIGRSEIVGKPIATLLLDRNATVTLCHSKTKNIDYYTKNADVIVVATGVPNLLKSEMVKENSLIIDVGINRVNGKLCGDCDFKNLKAKCDITPVPGGVGPLTVATLVSRLPIMAKLQNENLKKEFHQEM